MGKHWKYFLLLIWFSYLLVSGVLLFTRGFLLTRETIIEDPYVYSQVNSFCDNTLKTNSYTNFNESSEQAGFVSHCKQKLLSFGEHKTLKVILIVVDALKYEFVHYNTSMRDEAYSNKLTVINDLLTNKPQNTRLYKFIADPPTTTMQRLKGVTSGSLPTFIDVGSNFATPEINEDNFVDQLVKANKTIVFMGDDTWTSLYPGRFKREYPYPSFNVWDLDTVDNGIKNHILPEIEKRDWNLLISHFLGVDHCGHRYGPFHPEMSRKLNEMNDVIRDVIHSMDNNTILFVLGDHGMTDTGDHGGDSEAEVTAALFVYSSVPLISSNLVPHSKTVSQVDLVPTISFILNVSIPFSNVGSIILDALPSFEINNSFTDWQMALQSLWQNVEQTTHYIQQYSKVSKQLPEEKILYLKEKYAILQDNIINVVNHKDFTKFAESAKAYLLFLREMCKEVWVQFDPFAISRGLLLTFLTMFFSYLIVEGIPSDVLQSVLSGTFIVIAYGAMFLAASAAVLCYYISVGQNIEQNIYFSTGMVSMFLMAIIIIQNWVAVVNNWQQKLKDVPSLISRLLIIFSLFGMFSNSYIVEEARVVSFFTITILWVLAYNSKLPKHDGGVKAKANEKLILSWLKTQLTPVRLKILCLAFLVSFMLRLSHYYWRCREEQRDCESFVTHKPHSSATLVKGKYRNAECLFTLVCMAFFVTIARIWLRSGGNLAGFSITVTLARFCPYVVVVCTGGFWILQGLPSDMKHKFFLPWKLQLLPWIIYTIMIAIVICIAIQPLCVYVLPKKKGHVISVYGQENAIPHIFHQVKEIIKDQKKSKTGENSDSTNLPIVYGLVTAYSATFTIVAIFVNLLITLLLGDVLAPSAVLMIVTAAGLLLMLSSIRHENCIMTAQLFNVPWSSVASWGFLSTYYFYGTGHQPTFPGIHWDAAFVGTGGQFSNHFIPAALIGINTFASHLIFSLMLPLLIIFPFTLQVMFPKFLNKSDSIMDDLKQGELVLFMRENLLYQGLFSLCVKYLLFHGIRVFSCMLAATIHCRHLMVWKIFAPKFIFEALGLFVTIPGILVAYLLIIHITKQTEVLFNNLSKEHR